MTPSFLYPFRHSPVVAHPLAFLRPKTQASVRTVEVLERTSAVRPSDLQANRGKIVDAYAASNPREVVIRSGGTGQTFQFDGVLAPSVDPSPLVITVTLTAANLRGEHAENVSVQKIIASIPIGELVDLQALTFRQAFPIQPDIERIFADKDYYETE